MAHIALLTYPPEGGSVQFTIEIDGQPSTPEPAIIPAGKSAFVRNLTCPTCYDVGSGSVAMYVEYTADPTSLAALIQDTSIAITSFTAKDVNQEENPATITATFSGLTLNRVYSLSLWCYFPKGEGHSTYQAPSSSPTYVIKSLPGYCYYNRFLILATSDQAHVVVARYSNN